MRRLLSFLPPPPFAPPDFACHGAVLDGALAPKPDPRRCVWAVHRFKGCIHKSFATREEAESFLQSHGVATSAGVTAAQLPSASTAAPSAKAKAGTKRRRVDSSQQAAPAEEAEDASAQQQQGTCGPAELLGLGAASAPIIDDSRTYRLVWHQGAVTHAHVVSRVNPAKSLRVQEFDGASRRNPGPAGCGAVIYDDEGQQVCIAHLHGQVANMRPRQCD